MAMQGLCAHCGSETTGFCKGCAGVRSDTKEEVKTRYCGKECQTAGRKEHKDLCREIQAVKRLYRAANLLQTIFDTVMKYYAFVWDLKEAKKEGDKIKLYTNPISSPIFFYELPKFSNLTEEDEKAILSFNSCQQSVALMCVLFNRLLSGLCSWAEYNAIQAPLFAAKQRVRLYQWNQTDKCYADNPDIGFVHEICLLKLNLGGCYVLDLAAAQYGYHDPVYQFKEYMPGLQAAKVDKGPLVEYELRWSQSIGKYLPTQSTTQSTLDPMVTQGHIRSFKAVDGAIAKWEVKSGQSLAKLLRAGEPAFENDCKSLRTFVNDFLKSYWQEYYAKLDTAVCLQIPLIKKVLEDLRKQQRLRKQS